MDYSRNASVNDLRMNPFPEGNNGKKWSIVKATWLIVVNDPSY